VLLTDTCPGSRRNAILGHIDSQSLRIVTCRTSSEKFYNNNNNNSGSLGTDVPPRNPHLRTGSKDQVRPQVRMSLPIGLICDFSRFSVIRDAGYDIPELFRLTDLQVMEVAMDFIEFGVSPSLLSRHIPSEVSVPRSELPSRLQRQKHPPVMKKPNPERAVVDQNLRSARSSITKSPPPSVQTGFLR